MAIAYVEELDQPQQSTRLLIRFSVRPKKNEEKSLAEGRPIFEDTEYLQIRIPGDRTSEVDRPVTDADRERYAPQYRAWKANPEGGGQVGTPLAEWPQLTRSRVEELAYFGVRTVEQLAGVADGNLANMGPSARQERQKALDFLEAAKGKAPLQRLRTELEERDAQIAALRQQMKEQAEVIGKLKKDKG